MHSSVPPTQARQHVGTCLSRRPNASTTKVVAVAEHHIARLHGRTLKQLGPAIVGQFVPVTTQTHQVKAVVNSPFRALACRTLNRGAVYHSCAQSMRQMQFVAQSATQLRTKPRQPRPCCPQPLQQGYLRHVGNAASARLGHGLTQPRIVHCVKQQQAQQWCRVRQVPGAPECLQFPRCRLPSRRQEPFEHLPLIGGHWPHGTAGYSRPSRNCKK